MNVVTITAREVFSRPELIKKLHSLRFRDGGFKSDLLAKRSGTYIIVYQGAKIVGWGLLSKRRGDSRYQVGIFVNSKYRRQGIGTAIANSAKLIAKKHRKKLVGDRWSTTAGKFFEANKIDDAHYEHVGYIIANDWHY